MEMEDMCIRRKYGGLVARDNRDLINLKKKQ